MAIAIRFAALLAAAAAVVACKPAATGVPTASRSRRVEDASGRAPRRIELPPTIRPLVVGGACGPTDEVPASVTVQYEQPSGTPSPRPRIISVASAPAASGCVISQPAQALTPPAPAEAGSPSRRSEFVPLAAPEQPFGGSPPELPPRPNFSTHAPGFPPAAVALPPERASVPDIAVPEIAAAPQRSHFEPQQPPRQEVARMPSHDSPAMQAVAQRAMQMADQATGMAQRGMFFSARSELIKALQLLAQAADVQEGGAGRSAALASGLAALEEAREFTAEAGRPGEAINVAAVAARHRTPVLAAEGQASVSPIVAQQRYFAFAQEQLAVAAAGNPAASQILYRLGRMQTAIAAHDADPLALHGAKAMVFHQAALAADGGNYLAANELGVLLARYGQLADARRLLVQSVATHPHAAGWKNLAFVHRRLGEADLAQRAENELKLLQQKSPSSAAGETDMVRWVDAKTFAASPGGDIHWPDMAATSTARSVTQTRR